MPEQASVPVPQIPTIAPIQAPSVTSSVEATNSAIDNAISPLIEKMNAPLPNQYAQGVDIAEPHMRQPYQAVPQNANRQPITGQVADVKRARRQNSIADMSNAIGQFAQKADENRQNRLKDKLVDFMRAKTNAENATVVLNDPNSSEQSKQMAKQVLAKNKERMEAIGTDKKDLKQFQKAMDISFVDPEKNKTPEVQAFQKAQAEVKQSGAFNSDNPAEAHVAKQATSRQSGQPSITQPSSAPAQPQAPKSTTPFADAAMKKDTLTMAVNPQYAQALKEREAAQKQFATALPRIIEAKSKAIVEEATADNKMKVEILKEASAFQKQMLIEVDKVNITNANIKKDLAVQGSRAAAEIASANIRARATMGIIDTKGLTDEQKAMYKQKGRDELDTKMNSAVTTMNNYDVLIGQAEKSDLPDKNDKVEYYEALKRQQEKYVEALTVIRNDKYGIKQDPEPAKTEQKQSPGMFSQAFSALSDFLFSPDPNKENKVGTDGNPRADAKQTDTKPDAKPKTESVGKEDSDTDEDTDSDLFGNGNPYP